MIRVLSFPHVSEQCRLREGRWMPQSRVTLERVCTLANALAVQLSACFGMDIEVHVHEPLVPSPALISALLAESELYEIDAEHSRAWVFIDTLAARRLVAAAFLEKEPAIQRPWSPLERGAFDRMMRDFAEVLAPLCGTLRSCTATGDHRLARSAKTLLAMRVGAPFDLEIDFALAHDPLETLQECVPPRLLDDVPLPLRAIAGKIRMSCAELGALQIGTLLPMSREGQAQLVIDQTEIARGACGILGGQLAFRIGQSHESQGA